MWWGVIRPPPPPPPPPISIYCPPLWPQLVCVWQGRGGGTPKNKLVPHVSGSNGFMVQRTCSHIHHLSQTILSNLEIFVRGCVNISRTWLPQGNFQGNSQGKRDLLKYNSCWKQASFQKVTSAPENRLSSTRATQLLDENNFLRKKYSPDWKIPREIPTGYFWDSKQVIPVAEINKSLQVLLKISPTFLEK